jgi:hypothetical protein
LGKLAKPTQGPFKIIDVQQLPMVPFLYHHLSRFK